MAPTATQYTAVLLGSFLGAWSKGLTGFGSAILAVFIWVFFETCGLEPGSLQTIVVADCICALAAAVPMLVMTKAHRTADWRIVGTLTLFKSALAPVGAAMLVHLDKHVVELVMACVLIIVIVMSMPGLPVILSRVSGAKTMLGHRLRQLSRARRTADHTWAAPMEAEIQKSDMCKQKFDVESLLPAGSQSGSTCTCEANLSAQGPVAAHLDAHLAEDPKPSLETVDLLGSPEQASADSTGSPDSKLQHQDVMRPSREHPCNELLQSHADRSSPHEDAEFADVPLLTQGHTCSNGPVSSATAAQPASQVCQQVLAAVKAFPSKARDFLRNPENKTVLTWGSICGAASGLMEGMTGMGGPPIMYLYMTLQTPKDVARGTGAVLTLLQSRLIAYIAMGLMKRDDVLLYSLTAAQHVVVTVIASLFVYRYISQAWFSRILLVLMTLCCLLLFTAAAGIQGGGNQTKSM